MTYWDQPKIKNKIKTIEDTIKLFLSDEEQIVVDICSGPAIYLNNLLNLNKKYYLIDINKFDLDNFKQSDNVYKYNLDAGYAKSYQDIPRADIIIFCGVFTHLSIENTEKVIKFFPKICKPGAIIIWTQNLKINADTTIDQTMNMFLKYNYSQETFVQNESMNAIVASNKYLGDLEILNKEEKIFEFIEINNWE